MLIIVRLQATVFSVFLGKRVIDLEALSFGKLGVSVICHQAYPGGTLAEN